MSQPFFAHSGVQPDYGDFQSLATHLKHVAELTRNRMAMAVPKNLPWVELGNAAGWMHDLGKYRDEFQLMIRGGQPQKEKTWHKQAGAAKAFDGNSPPVAFAIAGHHGGLPDITKLKDQVNSPSGRQVANEIWAAAIGDCPELAPIKFAPIQQDRLTLELLTRLVFSCLVDADWSDTGAFVREMKHWEKEPDPPLLNAGVWLDRVLNHINARASQPAKSPINSIRAEVLNAALQAANAEQGLFSMTVPAGGGKTLSGLAFALKHAEQHQLRRIIYVAPYLSILDQNANVIREALEFDRTATEIFEHHSLAEPMGGESEDLNTMSAARLAENWDAPIIITTSVQFYESLFAHKPGRCRKLHNIARSVIILDECQTLPPGFVTPTCGMLNQLVKHMGCSIMLCTATQPAFQMENIEERLENVREIASPEMKLFERLRRVAVDWPTSEDSPLSWPEVASSMLREKAAFCIVNTRRAARELFEELGKSCEAVFHLSTSMCPKHREAVLEEVKRCLKAGTPCYLVSTQLIEAGVDIDFPVVLRELAPLEAIIQAAGRCNREGLLNGPHGEPGGKVIVFQSEEGALPPDGWYKAGRHVLTTLLKDHKPPDIGEPENIQRYFEKLYWTKGLKELDAKNIQGARNGFDFPDVAEKYRLIDDDGIAVVVAAWKEKEQEIQVLLNAFQKEPTRTNRRRLAPF